MREQWQVGAAMETHFVDLELANSNLPNRYKAGAKPRKPQILVGAVGIEPTTFGLKGRCSTTELRPCILLTFYIETS